MGDRLVYFDGMKSAYPLKAAIPMDEGARWTVLGDEEYAAKNTVQSYFQRVAWLHRGVALIANAVAAMPFAIMQGKQEVDVSAKWENKVGFMPNPHNLLWLLSSSLTLTNRAYLFRDNLGPVTYGLRYIKPTGVRPKLDPLKGLIGFLRMVNGAEKLFPIEKFVYFWKPSPYTEIGPADTSPAQAACSAAGVLMSVDDFASLYFRRGAIKATILTVSDTVSKSDRSRLKKWWDQTVAGLGNAWKGMVVNADAIKPVVIGEGLESLSDQTLTREKREDIATALGIPQTMLFSDASTNATAGEDVLSFLSRVVVPDCEFIQGILNEQVLEPMGLRMEFRPETLDAFQEDEAQRSSALRNLVESTVPLMAALQILGYELTDEQIAMIEEEQGRKEEQAAALEKANADRLAALQAKPQDAQETPDPMPMNGNKSLIARELKEWQRYAIRHLGQADRFKCVFIPKEQRERILNALGDGQTVDDVRRVFAKERGQETNEYLADLTAALRETSKALYSQAPLRETTDEFATVGNDGRQG
jgi:HK97 family phage portal protein